MLLLFLLISFSSIIKFFSVSNFSLKSSFDSVDKGVGVDTKLTIYLSSSSKLSKLHFSYKLIISFFCFNKSFDLSFFNESMNI